MAAISELPAGQPLPTPVEPVLELELDLASWAAQRNFAGTHGSMDGLGPFSGVELIVDDEGPRPVEWCNSFA